MYSKCSSLEYAQQAFNEVSNKNCQSWNTILSAYYQRGLFGEAFKVFDEMPEPNVEKRWVFSKERDEFLIDEFTVVGVVNACACLGVLRLAEACSLFDSMPVRNVVAWTALITGFAQNGEGEKALCVFKEMLEEGIVPNASTYVSVLGACADIPLIEKGKQLHGHIFGYTHLIDLHNVFVVNVLIDMYCKCGDMISAMTLFESHCSLLSEGFHYLHSMRREYSIVPQLDHYGILIDLLGRKNVLREAAELIKGAPWGNKKYWNVGCTFGCLQAEALFELEPDNAARYIMLSNIYTAAGRWNDARRLRRYMDNRGLMKETAYSWMEIKNIRHKFVTKDKSHSRSEEMKELLLKLRSNEECWIRTSY
ncbi:hypothetical protein T459_22061 [Capsicum annuum]|uniref:Pentatricopeptide repeat-containing protein n=1 Tax=Capsicum annuum TaxID=4072 RepID=A0A2G2YYG8_CAPAN|nr:hypothetical protein T459_22061 [Capsicum annuum]